MNPLAGLKPVLELADPRTLSRLYRAGTLAPLTPLAVGLSLPWLVGRGQSLGVVSQMNSVVIGARTAIHDRHGALTWRELDANANRAAQAMRRLGLSGGDRVALLLRNGREFAEVLLGAQKTGIVVCPLNTWAVSKELKATLESSGCRALVYDVAHSKQLAGCDLEGALLIATGTAGDPLEGSIAYDDFLGAGFDLPPFPFTLRGSSPKVVIQTSGTTGTPKGAQRDASAAGLRSLANLIGVVPYHRNDIILCPAPLFHSFGLATFTFATALGATLVLPERFDPEGSLELIERHRATAASFVPVMIARILDLEDNVVTAYDISALRIVLASGSSMSPELRSEAMELFGDVLYDLYGSTEAGWVAIARPEDIIARPKSVGLPVPGIEVAIFSAEGDRLGSGESGEIFVRSNVSFEGYSSGDSKEEREGFMSIGDAGYRDDEGFLFIEGRADDMVVVGGENVYPIEIEEVIESIPGVREAAVVGIDDPAYGQVLAAFVAGSATADAIDRRCRDELASFKIPRRIEIVDELPRTSTGKVLKRELTDADKAGH
ncbi:MAG: AMP-binding protein [Actinomycetota bacterium]